MFSNFKEAFVTRPQFTTHIPEIVLKKVSETLPEGFKYSADEDNPGIVKIDCDDRFEIKPSKIRFLDGEMPELTKQTLTFEELWNYCYNYQVEVELLPDEKGNFLINGKEIHKSQIIKAPLKDIVFNEGHMILKTPKFSEPFYIVLSGNGESMSILVQQVRNKSFKFRKFESVEENGLKITYFIAPEDLDNNFSFNLSITKADSATTRLKSTKIFNAFANGTGELCGTVIKGNKTICDKKLSEELLSFWSKVVAVEKCLNVKFDVNTELSKDDTEWIDMLYRCLVEHEPFKQYKNDTIMSVEKFPSKYADKDYVGKDFDIEFTQFIELEIFGAKIKLFGYMAFFDCVISEPINCDEKGLFNIKIVSANGKRFYESVLLFESEDKLKEYRKKENRLILLKDAKELDS